jgi:ATPase subunit of ABC transporter with duplicated ATPase domains
LGDWTGTMLIVSHDIDFVASLKPNRLLVLPEGRIYPWTDAVLARVSATG